MLKFTKQRFTYGVFSKKAVREFRKDSEEMMKHEGAKTRLIARRSMKPAPKRTKGRSKYGEFREYAAHTKSYQRGKRKYYRKGQYSRPGYPPYYHRGKSISLRDITYAVKRISGRWVLDVQPKGNFRRGGVPALHEGGGSQRIVLRGKSHQRKYPARPYMAPASKTAREKRRQGKSATLRRMKKLGPYRARRVHYSGDPTPIKVR